MRALNDGATCAARPHRNDMAQHMEGMPTTGTARAAAPAEAGPAAGEEDVMEVVPDQGDGGAVGEGLAA